MSEESFRSKFRILVVDRDLKKRQDLIAQFRLSGFTVLEAETPGQSTNLLQDQRVDWVISGMDHLDQRTHPQPHSLDTPEHSPMVLLISEGQSSSFEQLKQSEGLEICRKIILAEALNVVVKQIFEKMDQSGDE